MRYDILEYFSIYGTALSIWVSLMGKHRSLKLPPQHHLWQVGQDLSPSLVGRSVGETPRNAFELPSARLSSDWPFGSHPMLWLNLFLYSSCPGNPFLSVGSRHTKTVLSGGWGSLALWR